MPDFQGSVLGALMTLLGWDGTDFRNVKVDSDGHPQVDVLSVADLSGALESVDTDGLVAYIAKFSGSWTALSLDSGSRLMVAVDVAALPSDAATETSLQGVEDRIGALAAPASGSVNWRLDKILTQVTTPSLPSDAATETSLQGIEDAFPDRTIGFSAVWRERVVNLSAAAGVNTLSTTAVPAGKLYIVRSIAAFDLDSATGTDHLSVVAGGTLFALLRIPALAADTDMHFHGKLILEEGDVIRATFGGCTLNDDIFLLAQGWEVTV
ncbi:hypothetical protein LCGC14_0848110 [marine sediment metagenome]|uniref:Uncharacterized protein n=1 Tax=marine sediment metagenome TaxID=412755 RepID=A0A0F9PB38_9ZZZZ